MYKAEFYRKEDCLLTVYTAHSILICIYITYFINVSKQFN